MKLRFPDSAMGGFTRLLHRQAELLAQDRLLLRFLANRGEARPCLMLDLVTRSPLFMCSGMGDNLMGEIPTIVVDPLPEGVDQVRVCSVNKRYSRTQAPECSIQHTQGHHLHCCHALCESYCLLHGLCSIKRCSFARCRDIQS